MPAVYSSKFHAEVFCFRMGQRVLARVLFPASVPHHQAGCTCVVTWLVQKPAQLSGAYALGATAMPEGNEASGGTEISPNRRDRLSRRFGRISSQKPPLLLEILWIAMHPNGCLVAIYLLV